MGAGGVGAALGALRVGVLTDRWGSARVAAGALAVIAAGSCLLGTTTIVALLAIAQLALSSTPTDAPMTLAMTSTCVESLAVNIHRVLKAAPRAPVRLA